MLAFFARRDLAGWADVSRVFWRPVGVFALFHVPVLPRGAMAALAIAWKVLLAASALGVVTRASTAGAFVLGTYLIGVPENFGKIHHPDAILVWAMAVLALSRCGDAWSVDVLVRAARGLDDEDARRKRAAGEYTWPIRMMWLVMSVIFFSAGVSKLRHAGIRWVTSDALATYFILGSYGPGAAVAESPSGLALVLARHPTVCSAMAGAALLLELSMPLTLFSRRARRVLVLAILGVQAGIAVLMGPDFLRFAFCYVFWVPWAWLGGRIRTAMDTTRRHHFLYDGSCGICRRTVAVLACLDVFRRIEFHDALHDWPSLREAFPSLRQEDCLETMHVVTASGEVKTGFDAYRAISWAIPLLWPVAPFLYLPGVPFVGRRVYARVARNRHRAGCPLPERSAAP
jgi:predicted DCC family thiol-disulfide oxidoreductase YuxK